MTVKKDAVEAGFAKEINSCSCIQTRPALLEFLQAPMKYWIALLSARGVVRWLWSCTVITIF
jgi:hypothetical protein